MRLKPFNDSLASDEDDTDAHILVRQTLIFHVVREESNEASGSYISTLKEKNCQRNNVVNKHESYPDQESDI